MSRLIALWSAPRCRSTAFLRMMAERGDFTVLHEPFSHLHDFGRTVVGGEVVTDGPALIAALRGLAAREAVFFKDTTDFHYPEVLADADFLRDATHTFIVREPSAAIASHHRLNPALECDEVGYGRLHEIFAAVTAATGRTPAVVSSDDLVTDPPGVVEAYCRAVGIPYRPEALRWAPGMHDGWRTTARWHQQVSRSAGFAGHRPSAVDLSGDPVLAGYLAHHRPYYEALHRCRLTG